MTLRVAFFGTPEAAVPSLDALLASKHGVVAAVTAPDRPQGRGMEVRPSPVKERALAAGLPVLEPATLRDGEIQERLRELGADVFAVTAYGLILPKAVLDAPRRGCLNVHFSLLPRLRGAGPVQWALIEGYTLTGTTVILMDEGMDTGPVLARLEEPVLEEDTAGTLEARLAVRGAALLVDVLGRVERGEVSPVPQDHDLATYAPKLAPEDARIDWAEPAARIANQVRAFDPRPGAWTTWRGRRIKVWRVRPSLEDTAGPPGRIGVGSPDLLLVGSGTTRLLVEEVQPEGKRRMTAGEFVRGYRPSTGERFE